LIYIKTFITSINPYPYPKKYRKHFTGNTRINYLICILALFVFIASDAQTNSPLLDKLLKSNKILSTVIEKKETYKPQIIYTQINRDENNKATFTHHYYLTDSTKYFYCASLVKLPTSILALEKINTLNVPGLNENSFMFTRGVYPCHKTCEKDTSASSGFPSLSHYIKKMLLVSDNFSYSRVFEFLNPDYLQEKLAEKGYPNARIIHRFDNLCREVPSSKFNPIDFYDTDMNLLYSTKEYNAKQGYRYPYAQNLVLGTDVYNKNGKKISEKKDFTFSNFISLENFHSMMVKLLFHSQVPEKYQYKITQEQRHFLVKHLGMYPRESEDPKYNPETFNDAYKKYFIYGGAEKTIENDSLRVFNMIGYSYGFIVDCAYIVNYKTGLEYMLSAVLYTNSRNSFGSGVYEYKTIAIPFLKELSLELYKLENSRPKKHLPDLKEFELFK